MSESAIMRMCSSITDRMMAAAGAALSAGVACPIFAWSMADALSARTESEGTPGAFIFE